MPDKTTEKDDFHQLKKEQQKADAELHRIAGEAGKPGKGKPDKQEGVGTTQRRMG
jgi:hypothetical protein